ncbi:MAG: amidase [Bacteroidota bacterium]
MTLIASMPLAVTASKLRSGELNLIYFINSLCDRIELFDPQINAFLPEMGRRERLLKEADTLLKRYPDPDTRPLFFGIPIGVKDIFRADGFETHCGSALPETLFRGTEAASVSRLKELGALVAGKVVTTEFAYFEPGPTKNPHNIEHTPGGSSSGSAAVVAAGLLPFAFGTQTIGSVVRPAAFCGVFGYKPTYGRIDASGVIPFSVSADHIGFFTQDMEGVVLAASVLCNKWNEEIALTADKIALGIPCGRYFEQASDEIKNIFIAQTEALKHAGFVIKEVDLFEDIEEINRVHRLMVAAEMAEVHKGWFKENEALYRQKTWDLIVEGFDICSSDLHDAINGRFKLRDRIEAAKAEYGIDLWVTPATITPATHGLESTGSPLMSLPWTYAGLPSLNIPGWKNDEGLPVGLQFTGSFNRDETFLLQCAVVHAALSA